MKNILLVIFISICVMGCSYSLKYINVNEHSDENWKAITENKTPLPLNNNEPQPNKVQSPPQNKYDNKAKPKSNTKLIGYIIQITGDQIMIDLTNKDLSVGDVIYAIKKGGTIIHPVTKKEIKLEPTALVELIVIKALNNYCICKIQKKLSDEDIIVGMEIHLGL